MRAVLVFDGECGMCSSCARLVRRWLRRSPGDFDVLPFQEADLGRLGLTRQECKEALRWVSADGAIASGHEAVAALLRASRWWARPAGVIITVPGARTLAALAYRWVAGHRYMLPGGTPACSSSGTSEQQGDP